jgi:hypothetical protein
MGLLDDAIREHLDLKRRSGGDPTEIERLEREALGPVRREPSPSIYTGPPAAEREPEPDFSQVRVTGAIQDVHDHDPFPHEPIEAIPPSYDERHAFDPRDEVPERAAPVRAEPAHKKRRFLRGLSALSGAPAEAEHDDYDPIQPVQSERPAEPVRSAEPPRPAEPVRSAEPPRPAEPQSAPPRLAFSGESHQEPEPPTGSAPAVPDPREPESQPDLPTDEQATRVHRVVPTESAALAPPAEAPALAEPATPAPPAAPAEPATPAPPAAPADPVAPPESESPAPARTDDEADPLEETPEFLQDAPEHDRLWFEQRPPRDFDFDS